MDVGKRITELRAIKKITTNKLANIAGIAQSALRSIELGEKSPTMDTLQLILKALEISEAEFFSPTLKNNAVTTDDIDQELIETARKIKDLPADKREIVDAVIKVSEASKETSAASGE